MLKFIFWTLLLANAALFAYREGHLETFFPSGREPARLKNQYNADKIRVLPPEAANGNTEPAAAPAAPQTAPAEPAAPSAPVTPGAALTNEHATQPTLLACTEIGDFAIEEARRFEAQLAAAVPPARASRRVVKEALSHVVHIPPQGGKEGADRKTAELRALGVADSYIIQDNSDLRWGVSLGVFKTAEAARTHLAGLQSKGVRSARIVERKAGASVVAIQLHALDPAMKVALDKLKAGYPQQVVRDCPPAP